MEFQIAFRSIEGATHQRGNHNNGAMVNMAPMTMQQCGTWHPCGTHETWYPGEAPMVNLLISGTFLIQTRRKYVY